MICQGIARCCRECIEIFTCAERPIDFGEWCTGCVQSGQLFVMIVCAALVLGAFVSLRFKAVERLGSKLRPWSPAKSFKPLEPQLRSQPNLTMPPNPCSMLFSSTTTLILVDFISVHSDGAALFGFLSGLAFAERFRIELLALPALNSPAARDYKFYLQTPRLGSPNDERSSQNILTESILTGQSLESMLRSIGFAPQQMIPKSARKCDEGKRLLCAGVHHGVLVSKGHVCSKSCESRGHRLGHFSMWIEGNETWDHFVDLRIDYLLHLPQKTARITNCIAGCGVPIIKLRVFTQGVNHAETSPLLHALSFYHVWYGIAWAGTLRLAKPKEPSPDLRCAYWFRPMSPICQQSWKTLLRKNISTILIKMSISCLILDTTIWITNNITLLDLTIFRAPQATNLARMYFAQEAAVLISETGTRWADFILASRGRQGKPSLIVHCGGLVVKPWVSMFYDYVLMMPPGILHSGDCPYNVFSRGVCVDAWQVRRFCPFRAICWTGWRKSFQYGQRSEGRGAHQGCP